MNTPGFIARVRLALLAACLAAIAAALAAAPARAADEPLPPQGPPPPGANDFACKPSPLHPYPIVLVHGTFGNMAVSWNQITPALKRLGYCVYALDYGNSPLPGVNGVGDIPTSARQLKTFVNKVLTETGARKVSFVGHSQGGMMPRYFIKFLDGFDKVDDLVGMSPSSHGTTNPLASGPVAEQGCPACVQQVAGSDFMRELNAGDETPPPASYTVIETRYDVVVTPYESEFLPPTPDGRVTNILLQDKCPNDPVDHVGIVGDPIAIQWMLNALGRPGPADPGFAPDCTGVGVATYPNTSSVAAGDGTKGGRGGAGGRKSARLVIGHVYEHARTTNKRRLRIAVAARGGVARRVVVRVRSRRGKLLGTGRAERLKGRRAVAVRLRAPLRRGRYVATARARSASGKAMSDKRRFVLR